MEVLPQPVAGTARILCWKCGSLLRISKQDLCLDEKCVDGTVRYFVICPQCTTKLWPTAGTVWKDEPIDEVWERILNDVHL